MPDAPQTPRAPVRRLEELLGIVEKHGLHALGEEQLLELGRVFRRSSALLARARTAGLHGPDVEALNRLLARAYPLVHTLPARKVPSVFAFLFNELPSTLRREARVIGLAWAVFFIGCLVGLVVSLIYPDQAADVLLGPGWGEGLHQVATRHENNADWLPDAERPQASAQIMTNNIQVAIMAFALGMLLCLGSLYIIAFNGVMLGACAVAVHQAGTDLYFWSFVVPHGVIELPAIMISGAAGLIIGYAIIAPGRLYRAEAVKQATRRAIPLVMGVVLMLITAGLIEGFFSPRVDVEPVVKIAVGCFELTCLLVWVGLGGRLQETIQMAG
jgi:uncharacterized membrane protein SpoIIM required for sporulation